MPIRAAPARQSQIKTPAQSRRENELPAINCQTEWPVCVRQTLIRRGLSGSTVREPFQCS